MSELGLGLGRNSHVPACLECRNRKVKCSKTRPTCVQCAQSNRECVYSTKVNRTPLTREHLTNVETRLEMLEKALGKLFPSGELEEITRNLLTEEMPQSQNDLIQTFIDTNESMFNDAPWESDPMPLDTVFDDDPSLSQANSILAPLDSGTEKSDLSLNSHYKDDSTANNPIASRKQEKQFIDIYFSHYHRLYPFVHEATFKKQLRGQLPTCLLWPVLKSMIMAFGSWLACERGTGLGIRYYKRAQVHCQSIPSTEQSGVCTVQVLLLLGDFAQKQGSPEESWNYIAMAVQKAISLNLHVEPTALRLTALEKEVRRRVWWATYCSESCAAKIYGRPLVLPEEELITVGLVTNTHEPDIPSLTSSSFTPTDDPTIYSGLIQQSSYHRMANDIYRRILRSSNVTPQLVHEFEEEINNWHTNNSYMYTRLINQDSTEPWQLIAWRRQLLCDQSLRLLIHRPLLLGWLQKKHVSYDSALPAEESSAEAKCRASGLSSARKTIEHISTCFEKGTNDKMTLAFALYALFHALLVPVILIKGNPSSPNCISYILDLEKARIALRNLSTEGDVLSQSFIAVMDRLFAVSTQSHVNEPAQGSTQNVLQLPGDHAPPRPFKNIFGNEELEVLERTVPRKASSLDFSQWLRF